MLKAMDVRDIDGGHAVFRKAEKKTTALISVTSHHVDILTNMSPALRIRAARGV